MSNSQQPQQGRDNCLIQINENLIYNRCHSRYYPERGEGRIYLVVNGQEYALEFYREGRGTYVAIDLNGARLTQPMSKLRQLLAPTPLAEYHEIIAGLINSLIREAEERAEKRVPTIASTEIRLDEENTLFVGLKADNTLVLRFKDNYRRVERGGEEIAEALAELLPPDLLAKYSNKIIEEINRFLGSVESGYVSVGNVVLSLDTNEVWLRYNSAIVNNQLVVMVPVNAYLNMPGASRDTVPVLVVMSNKGGEVTYFNIVYSSPYAPAEVPAGNGVTVVRDFFYQFDSARELRQFLPSGRLIGLVQKYLINNNKNNGGNGEFKVSFSEAYEAARKYLLKYVDVNAREERLGALYIVSQAYYDILPVFPLIIILGPPGSGKKQLANALASAMPIYVRTGQLTPASLYRITTSIAPVLILDESERTLEENPELLNQSFEADGVITRIRKSERGKNVIEVFTIYGPKIIPGKPEYLNLREDTETRTIWFYMRRSKERAFPPVNPDSDDRLEMVARLLALKVRRWHDFVSTYEWIKQESAGIDQRAVDAYLPLLTTAYLIMKETDEPCLLYVVLRDMFKSISGRKREKDRLTIVVNGVLKYILGKYSSTMVDGKPIREVWVQVSDIINAAINVLNIRDSEIDGLTKSVGRYLTNMARSESSFVIERKKGHNVSSYRIDLAKLYEHAASYEVDISNFFIKDFEELRRITGLDWEEISFSDERALRCALARLVGNSPIPIKDCMKMRDADLSKYLEPLKKCPEYLRDMGEEEQEQQPNEAQDAGETEQEARISQNNRGREEKLAYSETNPPNPPSKGLGESTSREERVGGLGGFSNIIGNPPSRVEADCESECASRYPQLTPNTQILYLKCIEECRSKESKQSVTEQSGETSKQGEAQNSQQAQQSKEDEFIGRMVITPEVYEKLKREILGEEGQSQQQSEQSEQGKEVDPQCEFNCRRRYLDFEHDEAGYRKCLEKCLECPPGTRYDPYMDNCLRVMQ